jgi:hypothetical protein
VHLYAAGGCSSAGRLLAVAMLHAPLVLVLVRGFYQVHSLVLVHA